MRTFEHGLFGIRQAPHRAEPPCVELQSCDSFSQDTIFVNQKFLYLCNDTLDSTLSILRIPYEDFRAQTSWNQAGPTLS